MSHIPQNIVVTNHLSGDHGLLLECLLLNIPFASILWGVRLFPTLLKFFSPIFLCFFWFSCSCLAFLTFLSLRTRSNPEIMLLWYAVAGVCQERDGCWIISAMDSGHCRVVPLPSCKALSGCLLVFPHLGWHFPSGRADICQKARTSALMPWPAAVLTSSAALEEIRGDTR